MDIATSGDLSAITDPRALKRPVEEYPGSFCISNDVDLKALDTPVAAHSTTENMMAEDLYSV